MEFSLESCGPGALFFTHESWQSIAVSDYSRSNHTSMPHIKSDVICFIRNKINLVGFLLKVFTYFKNSWGFTDAEDAGITDAQD